jgi:hypothetical protein
MLQVAFRVVLFVSGVTALSMFFAIPYLTL